MRVRLDVVGPYGGCHGYHDSTRNLLAISAQAWVRNGYIPARKPDNEASPPFSLPPSQPDTKDKLVYPDECFTKFYVKDESDISVSHLCPVVRDCMRSSHMA